MNIFHMNFNYTTSYPISGMSPNAIAAFAYELGVFTSALIGPEGKLWTLNIKQGEISLHFKKNNDLKRLRQRLDELEFFEVEGELGRMRQRIESCFGVAVQLNICEGFV